MANDKKEVFIPRGKDIYALKDAINKHIEANVGRMASDDAAVKDNLCVYQTGILSLDKYLGTGGLLGGRIANVYGWEGTGKTLMSLTIGASIQKQKVPVCPGNQDGIGRCAFIDAEGTLSLSMANTVGMNINDLLVFESTPEKILSGEDYFDIIKILIQNGIEFIVVDSVPALVPSNRMTATIGQGQKATQAQLMSEGLSSITPLLNGHKRTVIYFINQLRGKPMVMYGPSEGATGGNALRFYETYALELKKRQDIIKNVDIGDGKFEKQRIGVTVEARLHKNKTSLIPLMPVQFDIYFVNATDDQGCKYTIGVDVYKDVIQVGIDSGVINKVSSWYSYGSIKANGEEAFTTALRVADPAILSSIRSEVLKLNK